MREKIYKIIMQKAQGRPFDDQTWLVSIMDSLSRYEMLYELEEEFGVSISEEDGALWSNINDIVEFLENKGVK
jgi:acyl carrier protein